MNKVTKKQFVLIIVLTYLFLICPLMFFRYPDIRNEFKYIAIIDDMIKNSNYLLMRYFGDLYPDKPPLYFWILIFLRKNFETYFYPLALIFGSTIPAMVVNILSFNLFSKFKSNEESFFISYSLVTLPYLLGTSSVLRMDTLMEIFIVGAIYLLYSLYFKKIEINTLKVYSIYILIGIGILVKGGAAFVVPIVSIVTLMIMDNNLKSLKKFKFMSGVGVVLLIVGIWLLSLLYQAQGKEYIGLLLGQETLGRALKSKSHARPFYYYMTKLPLLILPYTLFFIGALVDYFKRIKNFKEWDSFDKMVFSWFLGPFIFFSLMSGKLEIYLLPIFPAIMGMIYSYIYRNKDKKIIKNMMFITLILVFGTILGTNFAIKFSQGILTARTSLILSILIGIPLGIGIIYNRKDKFVEEFIALQVSLVMFIMSAFFILPNYNNSQLLKKAVSILKTEEFQKNYTVVAYRFPDGKNISTEIHKNIETIESEKELETLNTDTIILTRTKYMDVLEKNQKYKKIYENRDYALFQEK